MFPGRRGLGDLEAVVAFLDVLPERHVWALGVLGHIRRRHAKREDLQLHRGVAALEALADHRIDLGDRLVGHRIAAARRAIAMHHQVGAGARMRPVELVGKAGVEREVIVRVRVHEAGGDLVEPLGRLPVAFLDLGTELTRPGTDLVGVEQPVGALRRPLPDFKLGAFLEDADHHPLAGIGTQLGEARDDRLLQRLIGLGVAARLDAPAGSQHEAERHDDEKRENPAKYQQPHLP